MMLGGVRARVAAKVESRRFADRARREFEGQRFVSDLLDRNPALSGPGRLAPFEHRVFCQNGEDGVVAEIFRRIGTTNRSFVEFGCGDGIENNSLYLLHNGWNGLWLDGDEALIAAIGRSHGSFTDSGALTVAAAMVTAENIQDLFAAHDVPEEPDLISVDIDGNDYWVWKAIDSYRPRVAIVEYNAMWPPDSRWVQSYRADSVWDGSSHHGASLGALTALGEEKGYQLVHCDLAGVNAFFVRSDMVGDMFAPEVSAEAHYQPARLLLSSSSARRRALGPYELV